MKGLSHVAMGQFYEGIKAQTKVMLNDPLPGQKASSEYLKVKYLRGKLELFSLFKNFLQSFENSKSTSMFVVTAILKKLASYEHCLVCLFENSVHWFLFVHTIKI